MRITDDFWSETMQAKIQLSDIFNEEKPINTDFCVQ